MKKLTAVVAGGVGYVLGARAGRQRYEQIRSMAMRVKNNPKVQETARQAAETAKEAAPMVKDKVTGGGGDSSSSTSTTSSTSSTPSSASGVPLEDSAYPQG
jgi:hypothetical protein